MAVGAARQAPWNSITATGLRELPFTARTVSVSSATRITSTLRRGCTVATAWKERAHRPTGSTPVREVRQDDRSLSAPGRDTLRQPPPQTKPRTTWIGLGPAAHRAREGTNHEPPPRRGSRGRGGPRQ